MSPGGTTRTTAQRPARCHLRRRNRRPLAPPVRTAGQEPGPGL